MTDHECLEMPAIRIGQVLVLNEEGVRLANIQVQGAQHLKVMAFCVDVEEVDPVDAVALEEGGEFLNFHFKCADVRRNPRSKITENMLPAESGELIVPDGKVAQLGLGFVRDIEDGCRPRMPYGDRFDDESAVVGVDLAKLVDAVGDGFDEESLLVFLGEEYVAAGVAGNAIVCTHLYENG